MEKHFLGKKDFATLLGISLSTLERREKDMGYYLSSGAIGQGEREAFIEKMCAWEKKRLETSSKKGVTKNDEI